MFTFGWFSSGRDQAALDLFNATMDRIDDGFIPGRIIYVFCDRGPGESAAADRFQAGVKARGVPLITHSSRELRRLIKEGVPELAAFRQAFDAQVIDLLASFGTPVAVLAGYMLIASPRLCDAFLCLNLHPAVPGGPKGTWQEVIWQLLEANAPEAGAMMHLATPELDAGPPVAYFRLPLTGPDFDPLWAEFRPKREQQGLAAIQAREGEAEPLFAAIREAELRREFPLILLTLKNLAAGDFLLTRTGVMVGDNPAPGGVDLTAQVEEFLAPSQAK